jgi:hypothetical protein
MKRHGALVLAAIVAALVLVLPEAAPAQTSGTVVAVGDDSEDQCDVSDWTGIIQVAAGMDHTVGVHALAPTFALKGLYDFVAHQGVDAIDPVLRASLTAKVERTLAAVAGDRPNGVKVVGNHLDALVNEVEAQTGKKVDLGTAAWIIARARAIVTLLVS